MDTKSIHIAPHGSTDRSCPCKTHRQCAQSGARNMLGCRWLHTISLSSEPRPAALKQSARWSRIFLAICAPRFSSCSTCPRGRSMLPEILTRAGRLPAVHPEDGDPLEYGHIYVARPDHHLIVETGKSARRARPDRKRVPSGRRSAVPIGGTRVRAARHRHRADRRARRRHRRSRGGQGSGRDRDRAGSRRGVRARACRAARSAFVAVDHVLPVREMSVAHHRTDARRNRTPTPRPRGSRPSRWSPISPSRAPRCTKAIDRGRCRSSLAPNATARCGKPTSAASSGFAAASDTCIRRRACSRRRPTRSIARCGRRCDRLKSARR